MDQVADLIADMVRAGIDPDLIGRTAAAFAAQSTDKQAIRRREKDRDRKRLLGSDWEMIRQTVIKRDGETCRYCGEKTSSIHIDHIFPLSRGGTNDLWNLTVSCSRCNISKKDKTLEEWEND